MIVDYLLSLINWNLQNQINNSLQTQVNGGIIIDLKNGPFFKEINKMKLRVKIYKNILDKK